MGPDWIVQSVTSFFCFINFRRCIYETDRRILWCLVFDDKVMKSRLSSDVYKSLKRAISEGKELDISVANSVAQAMKDQ